MRLTGEQRAALAILVPTGTDPAHATRRARILHKTDVTG